MLLRMLKGLRRAPSAGAAAGRAGQRDGLLSFIICSIDPLRFAAIRANLEERLAGRPWELIRIGDARSLAEGYNRGLAQSRGEFVVFCHDDIELLQADAIERLLAGLQRYDVLGVAGTTCLRDSHWISAGTPHIHGQVVQPDGQGGWVLNVFCRHAEGAHAEPVQALDGLFIAARRAVALALGFDAVRFDGFHLYDLDFSFRAHLAGYRVGVAHDLLIHHQSTGNKDEAWRRLGVRFEEHFAAQLASQPAAPPAVYQVRLADRQHAVQAFAAVLAGTIDFAPAGRHDNGASPG